MMKTERVFNSMQEIKTIQKHQELPMLSPETNQQPDKIMKGLKKNVKKKLKELKKIEKDAAMHHFSFLQQKSTKHERIVI